MFHALPPAACTLLDSYAPDLARVRRAEDLPRDVLRGLANVVRLAARTCGTAALVAHVRARRIGFAP